MVNTTSEFRAEQTRLVALLQDRLAKLTTSVKSIDEIPSLIAYAQKREKRRRSKKAKSYLAAEQSRELRSKLLPERVKIEEIYDKLRQAKWNAHLALLECCRTFVAFSPSSEDARECLSALRTLSTVTTQQIDQLEPEMIEADVASANKMLQVQSLREAQDLPREKLRNTAASTKRRHPVLGKIDVALRSIERENPKSHEQIVEYLDRLKIPLPPGVNWGEATTWKRAYRTHKEAVTTWLSRARSHLGLKPLRDTQRSYEM
jgi:hypothetical protein